MRFCALLAVALSCAAVAHAAEPKAERQYLIKLKVSQGKADAKAGDPSIQLLSRPQVMTLEGKECSVTIGGEVLLPGFGSNAVEHADAGIRIDIACHRTDDESVRLKLKMTESKITKNDPESFSLSQSGTFVLLKAKLNTPIKSVLNEKEKIATWVELEVEDVTGAD